MLSQYRHRDRIVLRRSRISLHTWHIVHHGVPRLVEGNDVVEAGSVVAGVVHVVHVVIAPGVQRVVVHRVEGGRGPGGAGHWGHRRT